MKSRRVKELEGMVCRWVDEAGAWRDRAMSAEHELGQYKAAMDVRLAGDGLIEYRGHLYKRMEQEVAHG